MRHFLICAFLALLSGCGHVPLSSLAKLNRIDMMTVDPAQIRVAVTMPDTVRVPTGGARMVLGVNDKAGGQAIREEFILRQDDGRRDLSGLPDPSPGETSHSVFRIANADVERMRLLQRQVAGYKARHPDGSGGFLTVSAEGCRTTSAQPEKLPVTTWLKTADDQDFFALTKIPNIEKFLPDGKGLQPMPLCGDSTD